MNNAGRNRERRAGVCVILSHHRQFGGRTLQSAAPYGYDALALAVQRSKSIINCFDVVFRFSKKIFIVCATTSSPCNPWSQWCILIIAKRTKIQCVQCIAHVLCYYNSRGLSKCSKFTKIKPNLGV